MVVKGNKLVKNVRKGIKLVSKHDWPFFCVAIKCQMILVEIFGAPARVRESGLKASGAFL